MSVPSKMCFGTTAVSAGQRVADELSGRGLREAEDRGVLVRRIDRFEVLEHLPPEVLQRLPHRKCREGDVGRGERLSVVPGHAFAQLEGDRLSVIRAFPGGGEPRRQAALALIGGFGEWFDHLARHEEHAVRGDDRRVEVGRLRIGRDDQPPALDNALRAAGTGKGDKRGRCGRAGQQRTSRHQESRHDPPPVSCSSESLGFHRQATLATRQLSRALRLLGDAPIKGLEGRIDDVIDHRPREGGGRPHDGRRVRHPSRDKRSRAHGCGRYERGGTCTTHRHTPAAGNGRSRNSSSAVEYLQPRGRATRAVPWPEGS